MPSPGDFQDLLKLGEDAYRRLVEGIQDHAFVMLDSTGRVITWNTGGQRIIGYSAREIVGRHFSSLYRGSDQAEGKPDHDLEAAVVSGRLENEGWLVRKDGSQLWAHSVITSLSKSADSDQGFVMMIWDNTDHREGDEALRS